MLLRRVKWDEHQLEENEKEKEHITFMKIDEPNTPYIKYDGTTDQVLNWDGINDYYYNTHVN